MLSQLKVFRGSAKTAAVLYALGTFTLGALFLSIFVAPARSTAALGIIFVPLVLIIIYGTAAVVLKAKKKG